MSPAEVDVHDWSASQPKSSAQGCLHVALIGPPPLPLSLSGTPAVMPFDPPLTVTGGCCSGSPAVKVATPRPPVGMKRRSQGAVGREQTPGFRS